MWKVQLFKLNFDERERNAAASVVESGWLTMGERTKDFEKAFSIFLGDGILTTAVANGTAALHIALLALGIGPGDEVIRPALTFVADANVVRLVGATPVLADCTSTDNWNVSAESIAKGVTSRTKAVIIVHYGGYPCDMPSIVALCKERNIALIEDAAHAPGARISGKSCGTFGDIGCFSFFSNKNLSIGEGGMVATRNETLHERLAFLRSHGMTTLTLDRHEGRATTYDVMMPGFNYRMDEIRAAIGLIQLEKLTVANLRRKKLSERYRERFDGSPITVPFSELPANAESAYHIQPILLPRESNRIAVMEALKKRGVQSSIHYPAPWDFTAYAKVFDPADAPVAAEIFPHELTLPLYPAMTDSDLDYVADCLLESLS